MRSHRVSLVIGRNLLSLANPCKQEPQPYLGELRERPAPTACPPVGPPFIGPISFEVHMASVLSRFRRKVPQHRNFICERVTSDRTPSATGSRHSRPWPSLAPSEPEGARLELPPAGSRAASGIAPLSNAPRGDLSPGPRTGGLIPWVRAPCSRAGTILALREPGGARLELPPAGSRAGGGTDPPPLVLTAGSGPSST